MTGNAAVPKYFFDSHLKKKGPIPPGHRFGLFFPVWDEKWALKENKKDALKEVVSESPGHRKLLENLRTRQEYLSRQAGDNHLSINAISTSPFMTGIGNEHPLENGFSFLLPYGLPYLPGSGVKGIVRRAAEELALGFHENTLGWDLLAVWWLFGFESSSAYLCSWTDNLVDWQRESFNIWREAYEKWIESKNFDKESLISFIEVVIPGKEGEEYKRSPELFLKALLNENDSSRKSLLKEKIHFRGALQFWDVFPSPSDDDFIKIEILTPHYRDREYYDGKGSPADCGQPIPIPFLAVAPGCDFTFHIWTQIELIPESLNAKCRPLIERAFEHAFEWLGFGARTSLGYGQMQKKTFAKKEKKLEISSQKDDVSQTTEVWEKALLRWTPNDNMLTVSHGEKSSKKAHLKNPDRLKIPEKIHKKLFKEKNNVEARVVVSVIGNLYKVLKIEVE